MTGSRPTSLKVGMLGSTARRCGAATTIATSRPSLMKGSADGRLSKIIGTSSTIEWRRATQWFWFTRINSNPDEHMDTPTLRADTQDKLLAQLSSAPTPTLRSEAANLLGVLVATTRVPGGNDRSVITQLLKRSAAYFQQSIAIDPGNADAKQNLELVLRLAKPGKGHFGKDARAGYGFGRGRGASELGSGY